jgi:hypothetical protein
VSRRKELFLSTVVTSSKIPQYVSDMVQRRWSRNTSRHADHG